MKASELKKLGKKELLRLRDQIEKQIERIEKTDIKAALEAAEKAAKAHGFSLSDITGGGANTAAKKPRKAPKAKGNVNPPKYRNPENPDQTWTGKGRRPEWIKAAQAAGVDIETMAI